jgi:hypothetical protein
VVISICIHVNKMVGWQEMIKEKYAEEGCGKGLTNGTSLCSLVIVHNTLLRLIETVKSMFLQYVFYLVVEFTLQVILCCTTLYILMNLTSSLDFSTFI